MWSSTKKLATKLGTSFCRNYATQEAVKVNGKAVQELANDGTGKHTHITKQECSAEDCASKKCTALCAIPTKTSFEGHNTHKPPIGRFARVISEEDVNGNQQTQYFVPTNKKIEITEQEKQQYGKDIKPDPKTKKYVEKYQDKYE